jgi:fibronectin type 3 domain-containing protein
MNSPILYNKFQWNYLLLFLIINFVSCNEPIEEVPILKSPVGLEASKGDFSEKIEISWLPVQGANYYQIFKFNPTNGEYEFFQKVTETTYTDISESNPGEKVYYKIQAFVSATLFSELSVSVFGFIKEIEYVKLDTPLELTISKGEFGHGIRLSWVTVPQVAGYQIYKFNKAINDYALVGNSGSSEFFDGEISGFAAYEKVYYKIRSFNSETEFSDFTPVGYGYFNGMNYQFSFEFGSQGTSNGQFLFPEHVNTDSDGNIYISDPNNNRVQKFSNEGNFINVFHSTNSPRGLFLMPDGGYILARSFDNMISRYDSNKNLVNEFGGFGTGNGKFHYFRQIVMDDEGFLYVVDHNNHRIQKFDLDGNFITKWGNLAEKAGEGDFNNPWGITFFKGFIVVSSQNMIQFFTKSGQFVKEFMMESDCYDITSDEDNIYIAAGSYIIKTDDKFEVIEKIGEGDFSLNSGIALGKNGELIASSVYTRKIRVYRKDLP